ncbi:MULTISPECIES: dihydrodipicolinate synthase family protein [Pontibacillus]|uniref:Dihydrodipicolinate synthase family protein n=1 Tax=Pontibacillus chungwhensis TaxID=265426 RepID=A0ABY8USD9_9BACI|nr:dihydrodipicolinate synthase family protein [Pontibacillus chungwhensis]MCD5322835.1 dihydrodipicolinate synthase family protein [Pontibacillus sp. HN14]WIF96233.1 dihydrodipicolinate synthase family protein [Pontibacillus chungwhensis]
MDERFTKEQWALLQSGTVIPAHPLALSKQKKLDEVRQRALTNYYIDSGAGGIAVGVHTTQFEIRCPEFNLYERVLTLAKEQVEYRNLKRPFLKIAGICGQTSQALKEATFAKELGYDIGLVSMGGLDLTEEEHLVRIRAIAEVIPVCGFYLQSSVGGRIFSYGFWEQFADIEGVCAIKMAPFNRYQTIDVIRAVCHSKRRQEIALYTGNDDNIVVDLLTNYKFTVEGELVEKRIVGGLLGHWAVWTSKAVQLFEEIKQIRERSVIPESMLTTASQVTDSNAALFDVAHQFKGCIAGINEVLRRQGLLSENTCLRDHDVLSPNQFEQIDRIYREYSHLTDDGFVQEHLQEWLSNQQRR